MFRHNEFIRSEKHGLSVNSNVHADLLRTVAEYRKLVRALAGVIFVNLPSLSKAQSKCFAVERLFHTTADNPNPKFALLDGMFQKFPSYLRRAAIESAYGAVSSFVSNYARWQSGMRKQRHARPPSLARTLDVNPPLYGGQCIKPAADWRSVSIKVMGPTGLWGWTDQIPLRGALRRLPGDDKLEALSPTLMVTERRASLSCPVKAIKPRIPAGDLVCAVDLGINKGAVCAIVDSAGTVLDRRFLDCDSHNDQLDKLAHQVRKSAQLTLGPARYDKTDKKLKRAGVLSQGFCATLYNRMQGLSRDAAQTLANAILAFAAEHQVQTLVFERLKGFRPKAGGKRGSPLRQRFHRWMHRLLVKKVQFRAEESGLRMAFIQPRGTSAWAHDGSGEVSRGKKNYSLCTFASGKQYNADLNAALNIAARFIAIMLGVTTGDRPAAETGKSSGSASRMPIVLADVWRHAGAPI